MTDELDTAANHVHASTGYPVEWLVTCRRPDGSVVRHSGLPDARWQVWAHAHTNGVSVEVIAESFGVTTRWVRTVLDNQAHESAT